MSEHELCPHCGRPIDYAHIPRKLRELAESAGHVPKPIWYAGQLACPTELSSESSDPASP